MKQHTDKQEEQTKPSSSSQRCGLMSFVSANTAYCQCQTRNIGGPPNTQHAHGSRPQATNLPQRLEREGLVFFGLDETVSCSFESEFTDPPGGIISL
jgi:hypothetical protein